MTGLSLVTGGAGFIGRHLVAQLTGAGVPVRVLDPLATAADFPSGVEVIPGSVLDKVALDAALGGVRHVYHLAANAHLWARDRGSYAVINIEGTRALLQATRTHNPEKIVITSSETILRGWRDASPAPISEDDPVPAIDAMAGPYTRSKLAQDALAREAARSGLPVIIVYPTVPVGPGDRAMTAPTRMTLDLLRGDTPAMLEARLNFIAVEDAARGHILAAEKGTSGGRYILGGQNMAIGEFLALLGDVSARPMPTRRIPWWLAALSARVMELGAAITGNALRASVEGVRLAKHQSFVDTARARNDLGFEAGSVGEALRRQIAWLDAEGHL
ncbi:MAG: NAD-dependent epimerase/dehydratase family protein [Proteobacteria bacterium]|nr:NAD-dependent epimerase/dehydratase family protein [Pseudomonadota bacterium]